MDAFILEMLSRADFSSHICRVRMVWSTVSGLVFFFSFRCIIFALKVILSGSFDIALYFD